MSIRLVPLLLLAACVVPEAMETGDSEIAGGRPSSLAAVGVLRVSVPDNGRFCTATLLTPRVVLTGRLCLMRVTSPAQVSFAPEYGGPGVPAVALFPGRPLDDLTARPVPGQGAIDDIAVVVLASDIPKADTRDVRRTPLDGSIIGRTVVLAGFGPSHREGFDHGSRLLGVNQVTSLEETTFSLDPTSEVQPCYGDAGGPVFLAAEIIGVISPVFEPTPPDVDWLGRSHPRNCNAAVYTRVDHALGLVDQALAWAAEHPIAAVDGDEDAPAYADDTSCACDDVCFEYGDCCPECGAV